MLNKNNVFCVSLNNVNNENRILNTRENFNKQAKQFGIKFKYFDAIYGVCVCNSVFLETYIELVSSFASPANSCPNS